MNWQDDLSRIQNSYKFEPMDIRTLFDLEREFRLLHPGPWTMSWNNKAANYSYRRLQDMNEFLVKINFDNELDQIVWLLQNGN